MRIVSDLIKADGIIDTREIVFLEVLRAKYSIKKEDEILSASYTLGSAINTLKECSESMRHDLMGDFTQIAMSDEFCAKEEALLLLALRTCLAINMSNNVTVVSVKNDNLLFGQAQILYVESEYDKKINQLICQNYREISAEVRLAGFDFVYLPKVSEDYQSIAVTDILQIAMFLYPTVSLERMSLIVEQLLHLSTAEFCKYQMAAKFDVKELESIYPSLLIKIGNSDVDNVNYSNFLLLEIGDNPLDKVRNLTDLFSELYHNVKLNYVKEEKGRFVFTGFYKQIFDAYVLRKGVKSTVVADSFREEIRFPDVDVVLGGIHRREKALYTLFLMESASGGVNFNKPESARQLERYKKRMVALQTKYKLIYKRFGGEEDKAPDITNPRTRLPMIALLKKQIMQLGDLLFHVEDYTIRRNIFGNYSVGIANDLCRCCEECAMEMLPFAESEGWRRIAAL